ncbi:Hsc70-interacting protein [Trypanosoma conorhini]|uniref:Hsc70-interacting protein n=1 Tax=Trypanosoma conorhini TaxID=83891 RepID=A0A3R7MQB0_9TRYP|nr:Hsc70-interacting protein [Trypanosoma conorhini]RNF09555.1 Hsc70-interacting protein [Trypanosoma conorhini]
MPVLNATDLEAVNRVLEHLRDHPEELHREELQGLRAYMVSLGASIPPTSPTGDKPDSNAAKKETNEEEEEELMSEPDPERWELEEVPDDGIQVSTVSDPTPEEEEEAMGLKAQAADCAAGGKLDEAIDLMARALRLVPGKAMYWSQRASYLLQCARPGGALRDANRALQINPENVRALRVRGTVNRHLGKWEEALKDLSEAQAVDYEEGLKDLLKIVQEKADAIRQFRRHKEEKAQRLRQEALRRQREQEQREEERERQAQSAGASGFPGGAGGFPGGAGGFPGGAGGFPGGAGGFPGGAGGFPGGAGGFPGGAGGGMQSFMDDLFKDEELREAMKDPEVAAKLATLQQNPMSALQLLNDPKVGPLLQKMMSKAMPGAAPGSFSSGAGAGAPASATPHASAHPEDELD